MRALDVRRDLKAIVLVGGALLLVNAAVYGFLVRPRIVASRDLEGSRGAFQKELAEAERTQKTLAGFYEKLQGTEKNIGDFYDKVLGTKQEKLIQVQREIVDIGAEYHINPETVSYDNREIDESGLEQFSISVPVEGDYSDLRHFIAKLESSKSFLIIEGISLQGTKEGGLTLQLQIQLTTYFNAPWLKETKRTKGATRRG
jgi:Tfp pilus assembly protein PilO